MIKHASTSLSFHDDWTYDVFLNFRGKDTRYGFSGNLYNSLDKKGIRTFFDGEEIKKGDEITPTLINAIEESRMAICVFSRNYASSTSCLDELVHIHQCIKEKDRLVWPIFYDVEPSEVRHQKGIYEQALADHRIKHRADEKKMQSWKLALREIANICGTCHNPRHGPYEYQLIEEIVKGISSRIKGLPLHVENRLLGVSLIARDLIMGRHSMIKELHDGTDRWTIVVRVFRKWNVYYKTAPSKLFCISMVLIDEEGCKIQASVLNKDLHEKFRNSISEGKTYKFANFVVTQNVGQYRATTNDFKLSFTPQTYVLEQHASIPFYSYSFMPITEILKIDQDHQVNHLIDVLAFVRSIATLEEFRRDNKTKMKLRMQLTDDEENEVDCVLFDGVASNALMDQLQNNETPVVIVLNLARIGFSEDGIPTLYNSFNATRAAFNPAIKEVKQFIESSKDGFSPVLTSLNKPRPSQSTRMSSVGSLHSQTKITISQIAEQEIGSSFVISCEILKLETRYGWTYDGCSKCGKKATSENSTVVCPSCTRKSQLKIEPKLKVHYVVKDKTGSVSVIFWDKLAVQLIQKTAADLKLILQNEKCEYDFPDELDSPVGKSVLLKLKINDYNKKHPTSSISVGQFTICEYLMNQFMEATNESALLSISTEENAEEDLGQLVVTRSPVKQNAVTEIPQPPSLGEKIHDTVLFDLTNQVTPAPVKEKRRINVKRNIVRDDAAPTFKFPAVICSDERVAKVIKQEK